MKKKQGISLIVLVITIIVMIILATAVIITLNNVGIINKANDAVDKTNLKQVEQLANLAWADAYMNGVRDKDELEDYVLDSLKDNKVNVDNYEIIVDQNGVTINPSDNSAPLMSPEGYYYNRLYFNEEWNSGFLIYPDGWMAIFYNIAFNDETLPLSGRLLPYNILEPGSYELEGAEDGKILIVDAFNEYPLQDCKISPLARNCKYVSDNQDYIIVDSNDIFTLYLNNEEVPTASRPLLTEQKKLLLGDYHMNLDRYYVYGSPFSCSLDGKIISYNGVIYKQEEKVAGIETTDKVYTGKWETKITKEGTKVVKAVISNGTDEIDIGSIVNYMPNGVGPTNYRGGWAILGTDSEGRILIKSLINIQSKFPSMDAGEFLDIDGKEGYLNAVDTLNNICNQYKDGKVGIWARSATFEDIDKITGFDKTTYGVGTKSEYGLEITYSWDGTAYPRYSYISNGTTITGNLKTNHKTSGFVYFDTNTGEWKTSAYTTTPSNITTIVNKYYNYDYYDCFSGSQDVKKILNMFNQSNREAWATTYITAENEYVVEYGLMGGRTIVNSANGNDNIYRGTVHAVVTLSPNVKLTESKVTPEAYDVSI